jgi:large subunit ribosomal protein L22
MPETKATLRYLRTSAYKVREVLGLIRGLDIAEARHALQYCDRAVARDVLKVLDSAVANAENTLNIPADELFVSVAFADEGPTIKRWRPRARGRATRIRKRTSHITIYVARLSDAQLAQRNRRDAASASGGRRRGVLPGRRRRADQKAPAPAPEVEAEAEEHDHDHDHDHEHDEATEAPAAEVTSPEVTAAEDAEAEEAPAAEVEEAPEAAAAEEPEAADKEEKEGE